MGLEAAGSGPVRGLAGEPVRAGLSFPPFPVSVPASLGPPWGHSAPPIHFPSGISREAGGGELRGREGAGQLEARIPGSREGRPLIQTFKE